jgi:hypothetical protein
LQGLCHWRRAMVALLVLGSLMAGNASICAQSGSATSSAIPSNAMPRIGEQLEVTIHIDVSGVDAPDDALGSFSGSLDWDPTVLAYTSNSGILAGFSGVVSDAHVSSGRALFNGASATGATGNITVLRFAFDVVGSGASELDLEYSVMAAAYTFKSLLPILTVSDGRVQVGPTQYYSLTVAVDPAEGGTTDPGVGVHAYPEGAVVDVTAMPSARYVFNHWSGACAGSGTCQVTMTTDKAVIAYFTQLPLTCYTLTLSHTGQGSDPLADPTSSAGCPLGRYIEGETINLSGAIPDPGWQIGSWTGTSQNDSTADTNSLTMPASAHAVSVIYKVYLYLPSIFRGGTVSQANLPQTIIGKAVKQRFMRCE